VGGAGDDAVFRQTLVLLERADAALSACTAAHPGLSAGLSADLSAGALGANMETCSPETWARFNCLSMVRRGGGGGGPPLRGGGVAAPAPLPGVFQMQIALYDPVRVAGLAPESAPTCLQAQ